MRVTLIKQSSGMWKPAFPDDLEMLKKYSVFDKVDFEVKDADRSIDQHKMFFAFINFAYENQDIVHGGVERFRSIILLNVGHVETRARKLGVGNYEEVEVVKSISFSKMKSADFTKLFDKVKQFIQDKFSLSFDDWHQNEWKDPNSCANPDCHNVAVHTHEIIPGHARRQKCIDKGYQVRICANCHDLSHGKAENSGAMDTAMHTMFVIWCRVLKLDEQKVWAEIVGFKE